MKPKVIATDLPPPVRFILARLRRSRAELEAQHARVESIRADLWQELQKKYDLDLDAHHYRIDQDGRLVQIGSDDLGSTEESAAVAAMVAFEPGDKTEH